MRDKLFLTLAVLGTVAVAFGLLLISFLVYQQNHPTATWWSWLLSGR